MKLRSLLPALAAVGLLAGCPGGDGGVAGLLVVASVEVSPGIYDLTLGGTTQLSATPKTSSGIVVVGRGVVWSTTDQSIAAVSSSGVVTGMSVGGPVRIRATVDGVTGDAVITVRPVPVDHVVIDPPDAGILVNGSLQLNAKALDPAGTQLTGRSFLWNSSASGIAAVTSTGLVLGVSEGGPVTISATSEGKTGTASISVATRPATRLGILQQPGLTIAGQPMSPAVRVALQDDFLTTVLGATNQVTIQLAGNPGGATLSGTTTRAAVNGVASFNDLALNRVGTAYTFLVTSPGLVTTTSIPFDVTAGSANQLSFNVAPPGSAQSGVVFAQQPVLQLKDGSGNNVAQANVSVTATIASGPAGASIGGTTTVSTNAFGVATFSNLQISGSVGSYTLSFAASGVTPLISGTITLAAGGATALFVATQPSSAGQSNTPLPQQPAIQVRDAAGNNVSQPGVTVTASIASGGGAVAGNTSAITSGSGLATFSGLAISGPSGTYTLGFAATGLASATSGPIVLGAGAQAKLSIASQPSATAASGATLVQQPVVQLLDASSNPVTVAGVPVTATVSAGGTLTGALTVNTVANGTATFTDLAVSGLVGSYTLTFTSPGLQSSPASNPITLSPGPATQLAYSQQPSISAQSGAGFTQQPILQLRDAAGNPVSQAGVVVTATITGSPAGVTRIGTTTATTNASGVASFVGSGLGLSGPAGNYTLTFTAGALSSPASNSIALSAGGASQLTYNQQPSTTANSGQAFATQPILLLRDASNNPIGSTVVTATITGSPAGVSLVGTATATTNGSGVATFSGLGLSGPVGNYTLTFTAGAVSSSASNSIALAAGTPTQLTYNTQPSSTANSGQAFAAQPVLLLRDAANNPVAGMSVTATITGSPAGVTRIGTTSVTTNASGIASFVGSGLGLSGPVGNYTLTFTAGAVSSAASNTIALSAGTATQLTYNTQPSATANSGQAFPTQPVLLLRDAANNPVGSTVVTATITGSPAGVSLVGTTTATTNGSGVATFSGLGLSGPVGNYTLTFTAVAVSSAASNSIALSAGTATQLTYSTQPSATANSGQAFATQPVLLLRDAANNPVAGSVVTATITGSPAGVSFVGTTSATTNGLGVATFSGLGLSGPVGNYTLTFTAGAVTSAASNTIALTAGTPTQLTYNTQPSTTVTSGQAFATQPALRLRDAANNPIGSTVVTATITGSPAGVSFVGTTTATTNASGVATFSGLGLSGPAGNYSLTFTAGAVTSAASNTIALSAGGATQLTYNTQPSTSANSGQVFATQPALLLRDASNNPVASAVVTATITGSPAGASLIGTTTATTNGSGVATFSGLGLSGPVGNYTLTFTAGAVSSVASNTITLSAGAATQLTYSQQPSVSASSGVPFTQQPILQLRDAANNPVSQVTSVTATITGSPAGVSLIGTTTVATNGSGQVSFSGLGLSGPAGNYTLTFTAGALSSPASNSIALSAGGASQLTYNQQPSTTANSGQAFATQPILLLRDASNNPIGSTVVTATITGSPAGVSLVGTATATTNGSGVATFSGLGLSGPVGNYTLTFTAGAVSSSASNSIALAAGTPTQLTYNTQPSSTANSGQAFATQPVLLLRDAANNPIGSTVITATITGSPAGVSLVGTATATTNGSGVATFSTLGLSGPAGNYTLTFTAGALSSAASNSIALSAGGTTQLTYNTQPSSSASSGVAFTTQPVLLARDASNNPVASAVVTATITGAPAGVSLIGTPTATTNGSGLATFSGLGLSGPVGNYTLTFTAGAVSSAASNTIALATGPATQLTYNTQPSTTANSGQAFATQPALRLRDSGNNPIGSTVVTATITGSPAGVSLVGTATATTNGSGVATFSGLGLSGPVGNYTLTFTAGAVSSAASNTIALSAGTATQLTYNTQPSTTATSGQAFVTQPALLLRDAANNPIGSTVVTATITGSPAGVSLVGTATATTNGSGVATFSGLGLSGPAGNYSLTFTAGAVTSAASNTIALSAGGASQLTYNTQPSTTANNGQAFATQPVLLLRDASNNPIGSTVVTATITGSPAGVSLVGTPTATTNGSGLATFSGLGLSGPVGNYTLTFTAGAVSSAASNTIALSAGTPTQLSYNTQPSTTANSGQSFGTQPVLLLRDAANNPVGSTAVTATITGSPAGVSFVGTTTVTTNASGLAAFATLGLSGPAGNYTLTFTAGAVTSPASNTIALSAGGATQLTYSTQPSTSASSGVAFATQPVLLSRDGSNNPVAGTVVTATITGSPAGASLVGTVTATSNASGLATFSGLGISGPIGNYTLTFTAGAVTSIASNTIALSTGPASQLSYNTQPSTTANSGQAFATQPVLLLRDSGNNPVGSSVVTATITGSPAGVSFVGTPTATTNGSGIATFSGLGLSGPVGSYTLTFTSGAATSAASNSIALSAGTPTQLSYNTQPSTTANSGQAFSTQPVLLLRDAANNPVGSTVVTATITGSPAGVSLVGTPTATTNGSGVATFSGLGLSGPVGNYTLTFTASAVTSAASNTIALSAGTPTQLTYNTQPSTTANSGQAFTTQPVLLLRDAANNPIGSTVVTATITGAPAGVTFVGTPTATTNGSGVATFGGLGLSGPVGNYTLTFTAGAATSAASNTIALSAGTPTQLTYSTQPSTTANSGQAFATQPVMLLRDAANNPIGSTLVTATITGSPAGVSFVGTPTATTNSSGLATFSGLGLSGPVGNYSLTFTAGAVTSAASNTIALSAGTPTQLTYNTQPSTTSNSGVAFATQPALLLRDASNNTVSSTVVTATITGSPAGVSFVGAPTATTNGSGVATFSGLGLNGPIGNYTLTFTAGAVTSAVSNTIALSTGPASQLSYNTQPSTTANSGQAFTTQPVLLLRDSGNNPIGSTVVTATITGSPAGVSFVGTPTATTNGSGVATFSGLGLSGPAGNYTLTFTSGAATSAASNSIALSAGTATQLTYNTQPSTTANSGQAFTTQPALLLRDAANNPVGSTVVTATITGSPAGVSFVGTPTATTNGSGVATFSGLGLSGPVGNYTLTFTAGAVTSAASNTIALSAGAPTQLTYNTQPSTTANSGQAFGTQPVLLLRDAANNPVGTTVVTATITGSPAGVTFVGTATATTNGSGVATFVGLGLSGPVGNYTLTFTSGAATSAASNSIALSAGTPTQLTYNTQPSTTANSGQVFTTQPVMLLRDAANNPIGSTVVTATITGSPAGVSFVGTPTATTNGSGLATFSGLGLTGTVGNYTLTFTAGAVTSAASNTIVLSAGTASVITYFTQPATTATNGVALTTQPVLLVRDASNNNVSGVVVTADISTAPGGSSSLSGTLMATSVSNGRATFTNLGLVGPIGNYKLQFSANSGAVTSAESNTIALSTGAAANIAANSVTSQSATVGTPVSAPPSVKVTDTGGNPVQGTTVTFTLTAGGGTLNPASPAAISTDINGVASVTSWTVGSGSGTDNNTVTATATGLTGSPVTFNASGTAATKLVITTQPESSPASGAVFSPQPSIQLQNALSVPVTQSGIVVTVSKASGTGTLSGTLNAVTNGLGTATFTDLKITGSGPHTLRFTSGNLTQAVSNTITLP